MIRFSARRLLTLALNVLGLVLIGLDLAQRSVRDAPPVMVVVAWATWALWAVAAFLPERRLRTRTVFSLAMIAGGSFVAGSTDVSGFAPGAVGLLVLAGTPAVSRRLVAAAVAESVLFLLLAALVHPVSRAAFVTALSLLITVTLAGLSRRQHRAAEAQSLALLEERLAVEQERALVAALTERSRIARDLHDVLAHSLGGLAIQLEAVDALLESGRAAEARARVIAARGLAVAGLDEAKQAVTALREPPAEVLTDLITSHRALGGEVTVHGSADDGSLTPAGRTALRRAVQELLTNARRHAPGAPTTLTLHRGETGLTLTASTPAPAVGTEPRTPGGGHGLAGMRERVTEAGGTMTVRTGPPFEVVVRLPRAGGPA